MISHGNTSLTWRSPAVKGIVLFNSFLILLLLWVIGDRLRFLYKEHKEGEAGARFHTTIISIFSLVTMAPSILLSVLSITFFHSSVSIWFSQPVQNALNDANTVAELYLQENTRNIRVDAMIISQHIKNLSIKYDFFDPKNHAVLRKKLDDWVESQKLDEIFIVCEGLNRAISLGSSLEILSLSFLEETPLYVPQNVAEGDVEVSEKDGATIALVGTNSDLQDVSFYIWISKSIDPDISKYVTKTRDSTQFYHKSLENQRSFQFTLITMFALASLLLFFASIWFGMSLADSLIMPILGLIHAAEKVSQGDLSVRIVPMHTLKEFSRLIHSFNRMTERLEAQNKELIISEKKAAWSDIARKIAHEVKNPLTPIQLSAERLKKKYRLEIRSDPETFIKCIDTIIRQVSHIENLINEFSTFARMPEAVFHPIDFAQLCRDIIFMQTQAYPTIRFLFQTFSPSFFWVCDGQQMAQVLLNLLQNSINAIVENPQKTEEGCILVVLREQQAGLLIVVEDNGPGFPQERERLFEPYYTTRNKGTGLGMAIILRIVTEHSGFLQLKDVVGHQGACVEITLPKKEIS
ncbi:putative sensor histidine kinase NtrY-like protein [Alphaproteobacteria bacterium]|nr:putative sensor histidine kinase NtrY-like protein [Alphaproteobacteria bacterium]GHS97542.1 putative sensor histidine kinase NtrY-like protein [Alphaproteobacteria bacterium]